jgi:hypothetical protein
MSIEEESPSESGAAAGSRERQLDFHHGMAMRWEITRTTADTGEELFEATNWVDAGFAGPPVQVHPTADESYDVTEGGTGRLRRRRVEDAASRGNGDGTGWRPPHASKRQHGPGPPDQHPPPGTAVRVVLPRDARCDPAGQDQAPASQGASFGDLRRDAVHQVSQRDSCGEAAKRRVQGACPGRQSTPVQARCLTVCPAARPGRLAASLPSFKRRPEAQSSTGATIAATATWQMPVSSGALSSRPDTAHERRNPRRAGTLRSASDGTRTRDLRRDRPAVYGSTERHPDASPLFRHVFVPPQPATARRSVPQRSGRGR